MLNLDLADRYRHSNSLLHRLDPRVKVLLTVLFILTVSLTPHGSFGAFAALFALVMVATIVGQIGPGYILRRSIIAFPFALAAITLLFTVPGETLVTVPIFGGLTISQPGAIRFVSILIKSWISVQMAILL